MPLKLCGRTQLQRLLLSHEENAVPFIIPKFLRIYPHSMLNLKPVWHHTLPSNRGLLDTLKTKGSCTIFGSGHRLDTVAHACNPSTQEAKAGGLPIQSQPGLHSKILAKKKKKQI